MLVLSRKSGQRLRISDNIEVTVISIQGGRVQFGINAPAEVSIHRAEVQQRIEQQRIEQQRTAQQRHPEPAPALSSAAPSPLATEGAATCP